MSTINNGVIELTQRMIDILRDKNFCFIATVSNDGYPHVTPVWVDYEDGYILINTATNRVKYKNIQHDKRVALSIINNNNPYEMIFIKGTVIDVIPDERYEHIDKLAKRYLGLDKYPFRVDNEKRVILKIKIDKIYYQRPQIN